MDSSSDSSSDYEENWELYGRDLTVCDVHCLLLDEPTCSNVEATENQTLEQCVSDCNIVGSHASAEVTESPLSRKENAAGSSRRNLFTGAEVLKMLSDSENEDDLETASDSSDTSSGSDYDLSDPDACNYHKQTSTSESDESNAEELTETRQQENRDKRGRGRGTRGCGSSSTSESDESSAEELTETDQQENRGRGRGKRGRGSRRGRASSRGRGSSRGRASSRGRGSSRGRASSRGRGSKRGKGRTGAENSLNTKKLPVVDLSVHDTNAPANFPFTPVQNTGPHLPNMLETSELSLFKLFFNEDIVLKICHCSNEYAEQQKDKKPYMYKHYKEMTCDDFYKIVGLIVHFGYRKIPQYRMAWSSESLCYDPFVASVMSRNRFESLMAFVHLVDATTEKELKDKGDKLSKVRPVYTHLQERCLALYQPNAEISIDERMVRSKARFSFKQYIKNKPTKWGFKLWCLCDSHNGYTVNFTIYRGKQGEVRSKNGLGYDVVMDLSKNYFNQGYRLYIDNFYTSPVLLNDLLEKGVHATGTLKSNRVGVPQEVIQQNHSLSNSPRGSGIYVRDGKIVYTVWKDTKCVTVASNQHPGHSEDTVERNFKEDGKNVKKNVPVPLPVYHYNKFMGGVDRADQLLKNYEVLRQTTKYWKTLFFHFIDLAVVNAYILNKEIQSTSVSHYKFRENLVLALCQTEPPVFSSPSSSGRPKKDVVVDHYLVRSSSIHDCIYCRAVLRTRSRTTSQCVKCQVPLCFSGDKNCFAKYHHRNFRQQRLLLEEKRSRKAEQKQTNPSGKRGRPSGSEKPKGRGKRRKKNW